jgi:sugar phosphate isomerase/epimerase
MNIGVITASYVFRLVDYDASTPWHVAQSRFEQQWSPEHLDHLLGSIKSLGFDSVELWRGTTGFERWADDQIIQVRDSLDRHQLHLAAYCVGGIGPDTEIEALFTYAAKLNAPICTGYLSNQNVDTVAQQLAAVCERHQMQYAIENHGRDSSVSDPHDILALARKFPGRIAACPDTGNYHRDDTDSLAAVTALKDITIHTHLKDIDHSGSCAIGQGELPMADIVTTLRDAGYSGVYCVEREGGGDPDPLLRRSADFLRTALRA